MRKYLILIPLILGLISLKFFSIAYTEIQKNKYEQKKYDIYRAIDLVAISINLLDKEDINYETNKNIIKNSVMYIDEQHAVYAALYSENLELLSERISWNEKPFEVFKYLEFRNKIENNESGKLILPYDNGIQKYDEMSVYYKWIFSQNKAERYLLIAGVSLYTPEKNFDSWITVGTIIIIASLVTIQIWMIIRILKLREGVSI